MIGRLESGTDNERWSALSALGQMDDPAARAALEAQLDADDPTLRATALSTLLWSGTQEVSPEVLDAALKDDDLGVRTTAISALGTRGSAESVDRLMGLMDDEDPTIRSTALSALAQTGSDEAEGVLIASLDDPELSSSAMWGLQSMGSREGAEAIRSVATEGELDQRLAAIGMLGGDPSQEAGEILADRIHSEDFGEASSALYALQSRGNSSAARAIGELLDDLDGDDETGLRVQAASILQSMGGPVARERAEELAEIMGMGMDGGGLGGLGGFYDEPYIGGIEHYEGHLDGAWGSPFFF
jgi:HEAT repeat protein